MEIFDAWSTVVFDNYLYIWDMGSTLNRACAFICCFTWHSMLIAMGQFGMALKMRGKNSWIRFISKIAWKTNQTDPKGHIHAIIVSCIIYQVVTWFDPWLQLSGSRKFCIEGKRVRLASKRNWTFSFWILIPLLLSFVGGFGIPVRMCRLQLGF